MPFSIDAIHSDVLQRLVKLHHAGCLAHAYLFSGPQKTGQFETALALAQAVNCLDAGGFKPGCSCVACRKISDGNHPDIYILSKLEDKSEILIEQVRGLIAHLSLRALESRVRTAIIREADLLNTQASNAFLKTLEEPCPNTLLILVSTVPGNILKTVYSRCHEVRFFPQGNSVLAERLKNEYDGDPLAGAVMAHYSGGNLGVVATSGKDFCVRKNAIIDEFVLAVSNDSVLKKWSADKEEAKALIEVVLAFYRDVLCVKNRVEDSQLYNSDRAADVRRVAEKLSIDEVNAVLDQAVKAVEAVNQNFNVKVALTILKELMR